jgi:hypothetical protein
VAASFSLTGSLRLDPRWVDDLNTTLVTDATRVNLALSLTNGDGDGEADAYWRDVRTVAAPQTDTIDVTALPLSVFGGTGTLEMARLRLIYVRNLSQTQAIHYEFEESPGRIDLSPGGVFLWSSSSDTDYSPIYQPTSEYPPGSPPAEINVVNNGTSAADYEILLIGVKA